jgi:D-alanyl-D-alanine carboxypeptidase/D-alanyl-D-alanine-endopeptidase (penicillin-binding protein 4)
VDRPSGRALVGGLLAVTLTAGAAGAVTVRDQLTAPPPPTAAPTREPLPTPQPAPARTPLLPAAGPGQDAPAPATAGLAAEVDAALADPALGGRLSVSVLDVATGQALYERDAGALLLPASTAKIVTAVATLTATDPDRRLRTRVLAGPDPGDVVLVGAGDTTLASSAGAQRAPEDARLDVLARQALAALGAMPVTRVLVDDTLYSGPVVGPGWRPSYVGDGNVAPVMALMVDGGRVRPDRSARHDDPALAAGRALAELLRPGAPPAVTRGTAPDGARELAAVESPPLSRQVERMLSASDNDLAEALARQVALELGLPASFDGVARALTAASGRLLQRSGVPADAVRLADGSGLSRESRMAPGALTRLLTTLVSGVVAGEPDELAPLLTGLPVAGFDGTLADRYREGATLPGAGVVRAKTGTLMGVSALAGLVRTAEGRLLAFALSADAVPSGGIRAAERVLDRLASSFAACGCR